MYLLSSSGLGASSTCNLAQRLIALICCRRSFLSENKHDTEPAKPMNEPDLEEDGEADVVNASEAGCEAVFIPGEDRTEDGHWHFAQKYDEGNRSF